MPVYEHYCPDCHRIYSFFSRRVDTETRPACPSCARPGLARWASPFAIGRGRAGEAGEGQCEAPTGPAERRLLGAFAALEGELAGLAEGSDPRQAARLMRRLFDSAGLKIGEWMAEALGRMGSGEDPDAIDAELGAALQAEDPFAAGPPGAAAPRTLGETRAYLAGLRRELLPPARDDRWYPLHPQVGGPPQP
jgi:putative FmdB family regulatory protein